MHDERSRKRRRQLDGDRIAILLQANVGDDLSCLITQLEPRSRSPQGGGAETGDLRFTAIY
jgi:hypothetical protein